MVLAATATVTGRRRHPPRRPLQPAVAPKTARGCRLGCAVTGLRAPLQPPPYRRRCRHQQRRVHLHHSRATRCAETYVLRTPNCSAATRQPEHPGLHLHPAEVATLVLVLVQLVQLVLVLVLVLTLAPVLVPTPALPQAEGPAHLRLRRRRTTHRWLLHSSSGGCRLGASAAELGTTSLACRPPQVRVITRANNNTEQHPSPHLACSSLICFSKISTSWTSSVAVAPCTSGSRASDARTPAASPAPRLALTPRGAAFPWAFDFFAEAARLVTAVRRFRGAAGLATAFPAGLAGAVPHVFMWDTRAAADLRDKSAWHWLQT